MLTSILVHLDLPTPGLPAPVPVGPKVQALFYDLVAQVSPALAKAIHDADGPKPFTVSELIGPVSREGESVTLPGHRYSLRFCALQEQVGNDLSRALYSRYAEKTPLRLGHLDLIPTRVIMASEEVYWARAATYDALAETAPRRRFALHLRTPTLFKKRVGHDALPTPRNVFGSAVRRWNALCQRRAFSEEQVLAACDLLCADSVDLTSRLVDLGQQAYRGAVGKIAFVAAGDVPTPDLQALSALTEFLYYAGCGYGTTRGLGQVGVLSDSAA